MYAPVTLGINVLISTNKNPQSSKVERAMITTGYTLIGSLGYLIIFTLFGSPIYDREKLLAASFLA
eukprot:Pgem_evm1s4107